MTEDEFQEKIALCAYKPENECSQEERTLRAREGVRSMADFVYFLRYVKIIEAPIPGKTGGGIIPFKILDHVKQLISVLLTEQLISVLKSRQIWCSTTLSAYVLWYTLSHVGAFVLLFSKGQPEAKELLAKSHRIYDQLPDFLKLKLDPDSTEEMGFPVMKSSIKAFPSTTSAGISYTASIVVCDEHAEHPYADENYLSAKPTIDAGRQYISVFTENAWDKDNLATALYEDARAGKNSFIPLFFPYDVVPSRDDEWYEFTRRNIPERELAGLTPDLYMSKNYPRTEEEALSTPQTVAVFDKNVLKAMKDDCRSQINFGDGWELDCEVCHIYKDYHIGNFYIAGTDVSLGVGKDYNVTAIMDVKTGDIVADILSQYLAPEELAFHSVKLLERYHNPLWWPENNLWGRTVIKKALELGYKRIGFKGDKKPVSPYTDADIGKFGFTTEEKSRGDLFGALIPAINDYQIKIYNIQGLEQFSGIIRNANKKGRVEAMSSRHDDYPIAVGICWLKKDEVQISAWKTKPIETLTFR